MAPSRRLLLLLALPVFSYVLILASYAMCITGRAGWEIAVVELFTLPAFAAVPVGAIALIAALFRRARPWALSVFAAACISIAFFIPTVRASSSLRSYGFQRAAERAEPLVRAIHRYEADNGTPPATLNEVIPRYLAEMPKHLPPIELVTGTEATARYPGNRWALVAPVSTGVINWDVFMYFPAQNYPEIGYGGWIERIGKWAYVHE